MNQLRKLLIAGFFCCVLAFLLPQQASAQSFGIGFGLGIPLMDYLTNEVDREYRVTPKPGYYPILESVENAMGSLHLHADVLLPFDNLGIIDEVEIRFDVARFRWRRTRITHTACEPVDVYNGTFNDASAKYRPIQSAIEDPTCIASGHNYTTTEDISGDERSSLWFFHITGGARYNFVQTDDWKVFLGAHLGLTIATMLQGSAWFGADVDALIGFSYRLSPLVWFELYAKAVFTLTEIPDDTQTRINHETQTGGNIFTSLVQPDAYVDFQIAIRFDFNAME